MNIRTRQIKKERRRNKIMTEELVEQKTINRINRNINPWYIYSPFLVSSDVGKKSMEIRKKPKNSQFLVLQSNN